MFDRSSYIARAVDHVLNGELDAPVHVADGVYCRAEVIVRAALPDLIENVRARERFRLLVEQYTGTVGTAA